MRIDVLTLFPEMFSSFDTSIIKRAVDAKEVEIYIHDYREFSKKKSKRVDDYSYGGGAGMIIEVEPIVNCLRNIPNFEKARKIITNPVGKKYDQAYAKELVKEEHLIIVCGHYEGIDDRINNFVDEAISIGDFILTGGEIAAMAIVDSVTRLIPNVLGNDESIAIESFDDNLLEYPQYTRPENFEGLKVPEVLLSGNHENIRKYRRFKSLQRTYELRPDLLEKANLSEEDLRFLELIKEGKEI
jgi:tRNA (guanine37-N1)-methyltransferase